MKRALQLTAFILTVFLLLAPEALAYCYHAGGTIVCPPGVPDGSNSLYYDSSGNPVFPASGGGTISIPLSSLIAYTPPVTPSWVVPTDQGLTPQQVEFRNKTLVTALNLQRIVMREFGFASLNGMSLEQYLSDLMSNDLPQSTIDALQRNAQARLDYSNSLTDADRARIKAEVEEKNRLDEERREKEYIKNNTPRWEREAKERAEKAAEKEAKEKAEEQKRIDAYKELNAKLEANRPSIFEKAFMSVADFVFGDVLNAVVPQSFYDFDKTPMVK